MNVSEAADIYLNFYWLVAFSEQVMRFNTNIARKFFKFQPDEWRNPEIRLRNTRSHSLKPSLPKLRRGVVLQTPPRHRPFEKIPPIVKSTLHIRKYGFPFSWSIYANPVQPIYDRSKSLVPHLSDTNHQQSSRKDDRSVSRSRPWCTGVFVAPIFQNKVSRKRFPTPKPYVKFSSIAGGTQIRNLTRLPRQSFKFY